VGDDEVTLPSTIDVAQVASVQLGRNSRGKKWLGLGCLAAVDQEPTLWECLCEISGAAAVVAESFAVARLLV